MQHHLFEYAVIRYVPRVEREEFLNIGVILFCAKEKFLGIKYLLDEDRILSFSTSANTLELREYLCAMEQICKGDADAGVIGKFDIASRFRWLTATRSTIIQTSKVHPGLCENANETLKNLFNSLVL